MKRFIASAVVGLSLVAGLPCHAFYYVEGFGYTDASVLTDTDVGGTGWTASGNVGWRSGYTLANTPSQLQAERSHTWSVPTGYTPLVGDGAVRNDNESTARQGARVLATGIDMDASQTFYVSFMIQPDADEAGWVNLGLRSVEGSMTGGSADVAMFQIDGSTHKLEFGSGNGNYVTTDAMTQGSDYLVVARFVTSSTVNGDEVAWAFFDSTDDVTQEPDWTSLGNNGNRRTDAELDGTHDNLCLRMNNESLVGSIRITSSYSSAIGYMPIPTLSEWGLIALLVLIAALPAYRFLARRKSAAA